MGLISWFKNLFNKTIKGSKTGKELVFLASKNAIKIGTDIEVKPGYAGFVVAKGIVCDVFPEGRYRLEPKELPLASRKLKLTKQNRKGQLPQKIKADIYFVNMNGFAGTFRSKSFVKANGDGYKRVKIRLGGKFSFKIVNAVDFLEGLLTQFGLIQNHMAIDEVGEWIAELCVKQVQKNKPNLYDLFKQKKICFDYVNKELYDCGVRIENLEITETEFPKRIARQLTQKYFLQDNERTENPVKVATEKQFEDKSEQVYESEASKIEEQMANSTYNFDSEGQSQVDNMDTGYENVDYQSQYDNSQDTIKKTISYKKCLNCNAINSSDAHTCFACGHNFDE